MVSYSNKVKVPEYRARSAKPDIHTLYNLTEYNKKIALIEKMDLSDDIKFFLKQGAIRFIDFNYSNIAEYYCHADKEMKDLMERLALIVIDFDKAVEYGFVEMNKKLKEILS